jgi:hypothetical protein
VSRRKAKRSSQHINVLPPGSAGFLPVFRRGLPDFCRFSAGVCRIFAGWSRRGLPDFCRCAFRILRRGLPDFCRLVPAGSAGFLPVFRSSNPTFAGFRPGVPSFCRLALARFAEFLWSELRARRRRTKTKGCSSPRQFRMLYEDHGSEAPGVWLLRLGSFVR